MNVDYIIFAVVIISITYFVERKRKAIFSELYVKKCLKSRPFNNGDRQYGGLFTFINNFGILNFYIRKLENYVADELYRL